MIWYGIDGIAFYLNKKRTIVSREGLNQRLRSWSLQSCGVRLHTKVFDLLAIIVRRMMIIVLLGSDVWASYNS